jgi:lambda family phage minor tail protein L
MSTLAAELQKLAPSAYIELFEVDLTSLGDSVYRFHAGTNSLSQPIVWQGQTYTPWPAQADGFEYSSNGTIPRPKLILANVNGTITALVLLLGDCVVGKVTRKRTMAKYLDAANFSGGNAFADSLAHFPDEVYFIERKASETKNQIEFELTAAFDVTGVQLPRRQIIQNVCPWKYRGAECSYTGTSYFKADDTSTANVGEDVCGKRLSSCKARFGATAELPYGGFPGAGLL